MARESFATSPPPGQGGSGCFISTASLYCFGGLVWSFVSDSCIVRAPVPFAAHWRLFVLCERQRSSRPAPLWWHRVRRRRSARSSSRIGSGGGRHRRHHRRRAHPHGLPLRPRHLWSPCHRLRPVRHDVGNQLHKIVARVVPRRARQAERRKMRQRPPPWAQSIRRARWTGAGRCQRGRAPERRAGGG